MNDLNNKYSITPEFLAAVGADVARIESAPGRDLRRTSLRNVLRFSRLDNLTSDEWIEVRALNCRGPRWTYQLKEDTSITFNGTVTGYFQAVDDIINAVVSGGDGDIDRVLSTSLNLDSMGYFYIPAVIQRDKVHSDLCHHR